MPIELLWWFKPLLLTGVLMLFMGAMVAFIILGEYGERTEVAVLVFAFSALPFLLGVFCYVGWFLANILILIWRH